MFFPRLRRHAKWMFLLLAVALGLGFVVFGVGAGGVGVGDIIRGSSDTSASVGDARERTEKNPDDAEAWRDLATALQTDGDTAGAIAALEEYTVLRPNDADAYSELGGLHIVDAQELSRQASLAQAKALYDGGGGLVPADLTVGGKQLATDPIATAVTESANAQIVEISQLSQAAYQKAVTAFQSMARLSPGDPQPQIDLANAAQQAGDYATAIAAYERWLKLAPEDSQAPIIKQQLKQLRAAQAAASG